MNFDNMTDNDLRARIAQLQPEADRFSVNERTLKLLLVSAYGMIGNEFSRYFDVRIAESITVSGQLSIRWIERALNNHLNTTLNNENDKGYAVGGDTDSIYITVKDVVDKHLEDKSTKQIVSALDKYAEARIQPVITASYNELALYMNAYAQKMKMSRECIAERGIWRAKKNYALSVWDLEGVRFEDEPYLKIVGIECIKSSTPEMCRIAIKESIRLIMTSDESTVQSYIKTFKKTFFTAPVEDISKNTGISNIEPVVENEDTGLGIKSYLDINFKKGTSYHVKGAMVYNQMLVKYDLTQKYKTVMSGNKVRLVYLRKENPTRNNVIAYPDILPPEFKLDNCIDRPTQFNKNFLNPIKSLLDLAGWDFEKKIKLF